MNPKAPLQKRRKYDETFKAEMLKRVGNDQAVSEIPSALGEVRI